MLRKKVFQRKNMVYLGIKAASILKRLIIGTEKSRIIVNLSQMQQMDEKMENTLINNGRPVGDRIHLRIHLHDHDYTGYRS